MRDAYACAPRTGTLPTGAIRGHRLAGRLWARGPLPTGCSQRTQLPPVEPRARFFSWHPPTPRHLQSVFSPFSSSGVPQQSLFSALGSVVWMLHRATSTQQRKRKSIPTHAQPLSQSRVLLASRGPFSCAPEGDLPRI